MSRDEERGRAEAPAETGPLAPASERAYSEDGVDLTLIRWMLSLTPLERLEALQSSLRAIGRLRDAASRA